MVAVTDALLFMGAFVGAYWVRTQLLSELFPDRLHGLLPLRAYVWLLWVAIPVYEFMLYRRGQYTVGLQDARFASVIGLIRPFVMGSLVLGTAVFLFQAKNFSRPLFCLFVAFSTIAIATSRVVIYTALRRPWIRKQVVRYGLIVGTNSTAIGLAEALSTWPGSAIVQVGHLTEEERPPRSLRILGRLSDVGEVLSRTVIDEVFIALPTAQLEKAEEVIRACEEQGIAVHVHLGFAQGFIGRPQFNVLNGIPTLSLSATPHDALDIIIKRVVDVVGSVIGLVCLSPIMLIAAVAIRLSAGSPIIYRQTRKGLNGREFVLYKFRTMTRDADLRKSDLLDKNEMSGPVFKISRDPRVTRVGKMLRLHSIDEVPQLWNVLKGDMSLVGPRPPLPDEVVQYEPRYRRRLSVKPGITCLWQVSGRNNVDFERWMALDAAYIQNWSLALDLKILLKTIPAVLLTRGAR